MRSWRHVALRSPGGCGKTSRPAMSYGAIGKSVFNYLLVFLGGGLGASLRPFVNIACAKGIGTAFPYATFIINISGSTAMSLIARYLAFNADASQPWRLSLMTGITGGHTTF